MEEGLEVDYGRHWATGTVPYDPTLQRYIRKPLPDEPTYDLCESCRTIDFKAIRDVEPTTVAIGPEDFLPVFSFPEGLQWLTLSCPFCRVMKPYIEPFITIWQKGTKRKLITWTLGFAETRTRYTTELALIFYVADRDQVYEFRIPPHELLLYAMAPTVGKHCVLKPQRHMNDSWMRKELELCQSLHGHETSTTTVPEMRLMDCATMTVVPAPENAEYLALSYVWSKSGDRVGNSSPGQMTGPVAVTATIGDAARLVLRLGKQFLWVDRLCIDQYSLEQRRQQIASMGRIYRNAFATIVMLDGDDSRPLPGVSNFMTDRRFARVRSGMIASRGRLPDEVENSTWHDRGWTFQEAYLSTRIIYMSRFGILLSCRRHVLEELPLEVDPASNPRILWHPLSEHVKGGVFDAGSAYPWDVAEKGVMTSLENYTRRSLTYERDALDAFRGYLQSCGAWSYWGIPILDFEGILTEFKNPGSLFAASGYSLGFCRGLSWCRFGPPSQEGSTTTQARHVARGLSPSWAWLSARRGACYYGLVGMQSLSVVPSRISMMTDAGISSVETFFGQDGPPHPMPEESPYLQVKASLLPITNTFDPIADLPGREVDITALSSSNTMEWRHHSELADHDDTNGREARATHVLLLWAAIDEQLDPGYEYRLTRALWYNCNVYWLSVVECTNFWRRCGLVTSHAKVRVPSAVDSVRRGTEGPIGESGDFSRYQATALLEASRDALARELGKLRTRTILLG